MHRSAVIKTKETVEDVNILSPLSVQTQFYWDSLKKLQVLDEVKTEAFLGSE